MSSQTHEIILAAKRYFKHLWAALRGKDPCAGEREELRQRIAHSDEGLTFMREMYQSALDKWNEESAIVKQQEKALADLQHDIASYQKLVETLRTSIRDKEQELSEQRQRFLEQLEAARNQTKEQSS